MKKIVFLVLIIILRGGLLSAQDLSKNDLLNDIDSYAKLIASKHVNPFSNVSKNDFLKSVDDLKKSSDYMNTYQLMVGLLEINGSLKDEHTDIDFNQRKFYPLSFYWFEEGIVITKIPEKDSLLLGAKLLSVNDISIDTLLIKLKNLTGVNTPTGFKSKVPGMLNDPIIMQGLTIYKENDELTYTFLKNDSEKINIKYTPIEPTKDGKVGLQPIAIPFSNSDKSIYWYKYIAENNLLFFQYNRCIDDPQKPFKDFLENFKNEIEKSKPKKLVIDLRYNGGGNSAILKPFIKIVASMPELKGKKINTLIGRRTYSSSVLNAWQMQTEAHSLIVGEETGGKLNHTGEVKSFTLEHTGFTVYYSTKNFKLDESHAGGIKPDKEIKYSLKDFMNGIDPALEYIIEN